MYIFSQLVKILLITCIFFITYNTLPIYEQFGEDNNITSEEDNTPLMIPDINDYNDLHYNNTYNLMYGDDKNQDSNTRSHQYYIDLYKNKHTHVPMKQLYPYTPFNNDLY
jgi:hypothetical protein